MKKSCAPKILILSVLLVFIFSNTSAQRAYLFGPDITVNKNDSVLIHLDEYVGNIQWERSFDAIIWNALEGATSDTLHFVADSTSYIRARVTAGDCDPFLSDTTLVVVYQTTDESFFVDKEKLTLISNAEQLANGQYIYQEDVSGIQPGSVLVSSDGMGYMRKVIGIQRSENGTILETEEAALTDVVTQMQLSDSLILTMSDDNRAFINGKPVPVHSFYLIPGAKIRSDKSGIDLSGVLFSFNIIVGDTIGKIKASIPQGHILFEPVIYRDLDIGFIPPRVNYFSLTAGGEIDFNLDVKVEAEVVAKNIDRSIRILFAVIGPIPIGPVPMFIEFSLNKSFKAGINASGELTFGYESNFSAVFGAEYNRSNSPQWSPVFETGAYFNEKPFDFNLTANAFAQVGVGPRLDVTIAGMAGPYLTIDPFLKANLTAGYPWTWNFLLNTGIDSRLGFEVGVLNKTLIKFYRNIPGPSWTIFELGGNYEHEIPIVETVTVTNIEATSAICGGNVIIEGNSPVTARGVVWNTSPNPSLSSNEGFTVDGSGSGEFISQLTDLSPSTPYYVRAYATNSNGTGYGEQKSFTTAEQLFVPTVTTDQITDIMQNSATGGGNVTDSGGSTVTERGICFSTNPNPTINDHKVTAGSGTGSFTAELTGLSPNTTYYVRAYAINSEGPGYGNEVNFTTDTDDFICGQNVTFTYKGQTVTYGTVQGQNGTCWMDRNLGASRVATAYNDAQAYGDLFQWGRLDDGHQNRNSGTTSTLSNSDNPGHGLFILSHNFPHDWRDPQNDYLWDDLGGVNNPCPVGWRVPSKEEYESERDSWGTFNHNYNGAFNSPLKLTAGGIRQYGSGNLTAVGNEGYYWINESIGPYSMYFVFSDWQAGFTNGHRASGRVVRCIRN